MARNERVEFLKVLIAAAWADGEISYQEMNTLKEYFRRLDLSDDELTELEPYLADPIGEDEARVIVQDYLEVVGGGERATALAAIRDLLLADEDLGRGEDGFLELFSEVERDTPTASVFVGRLKRLWARREPSAPAERFRRSDLLDEFVRNRVLYQVKRRLQQATGTSELDADTERELREICALGALLGHVAAADGHFDSDEYRRIGQLLEGVGGLPRTDIDIIVAIVESQVLSDVGYYDFARELKELHDTPERERLVTLLFEVAAADGEISHDESEEIRKISKALDLAHGSFVAAKEQARQA